MLRDVLGGVAKRAQGEASRSITPERRVADLKLMIANSKIFFRKNKREKTGSKAADVLLSYKTVGVTRNGGDSTLGQGPGISMSSFYAGEDESRKRSFLRRTSSSRSPVRATKDLFDPRAALCSVALNIEKKDPSRNDGVKL